MLGIQDSISQPTSSPDPEISNNLIDVAEEDIVDDDEDVTEYSSAHRVQNNEALGSQFEKMTIDNRGYGSNAISERLVDRGPTAAFG